MSSSSGSDDELFLSNFIVGDDNIGKYKLVRKLGSGAFGDIYLGVNINEVNDRVAVKLEGLCWPRQFLPYETWVYKILRRFETRGFPQLKWWGQDKERQFNILVLELLGPSLEELFEYCCRKFSLKTVLMLAEQLLQRIECLHRSGFVHRDIKPENVLVGLNRNARQLYMIDLGLAKTYWDPKTQCHIPFREDHNREGVTGTARYASLNAHRGMELSRRDDLETIGHVLVYFLKGSLPWMGIKGQTKKQKYKKIREIKEKTLIGNLCEGLPPEFATYFYYCRGLRFEDIPNYSFLRQLFRKVFKMQGYQLDYQFDWMRDKRRRIRK
ncbi:unnamed protein product [Orchesella dallaii]|uniref:non-specific serine/threonine protein kinase n=1 Tax=Orchesella dallaii TaxID=48710 RepID=A0ABP1Q1I0_9HEXA